MTKITEISTTTRGITEILRGGLSQAASLYNIQEIAIARISQLRSFLVFETITPESREKYCFATLPARKVSTSV